MTDLPVAERHEADVWLDGAFFVRALTESDAQTIVHAFNDLHAVTTQRDFLVSEMQTLRHSLNDERLRAAQIKETFDGLTTDMSLMEEQLRAYAGRVVPDYPDE